MLAKTDNDLSIHNLRKCIFNGTRNTYISEALQGLYNSENRPVWCYKRQAGSNQVICISKDYVSEFCKLFGFIYRDMEIIQKTENDLCAKNLCPYIMYGTKNIRKISEALQDLYDSKERPSWCYKRQNRTNYIVCISKDYVDEFCKMFGFGICRHNILQNIKENDLLPKTENDLNIVDLKKYIQYWGKQYQLIVNALGNLYNSEDRPSWCYKRQSGNRQSICISKDYIKDFCDLCNFKLNGARQNLLQRTENDLCIKDLCNGIVHGYNYVQKITESLQSLYDSKDRPSWCCKKQSGSRQAIYISKDYLEEFCNMFGFVKKDEKIPQKTENDLNVKDLCKVITNSTNKYSEILSVLQRLYNSEQRPEWCYKRQSGKRQSICISKDHLKDFYHLYHKSKEYFDFAQQQSDKKRKYQPDLRVEDLIQRIPDGIKLSSKISEALRTLYTSTPRPEWCYTIKQKHSKLCPICINEDHFEDFCLMFGFVPNNYRLLQKTEKDLCARYLRKYIVNGTKNMHAISTSLQELYGSENRPDWCYKRQSGNRPIICISKDYLEEFCVLYGFVLNDVDIKLDLQTKNDLPATNVCQYIVDGHAKSHQISTILKSLYDSEQRPDWCYKRQCGNRQHICIARDYLSEFCKLYNFKLKDLDNGILNKEKNDYYVRDIIKYIKNGVKKYPLVSEILQELYDSENRPEWCYKRMSTIRRPIICISKEHLEEFCTMFSLVLKKSILSPKTCVSEKKTMLPCKTENDLSAKYLRKYIVNGTKNVRAILTSLQELYGSENRPDWCYKRQIYTLQVICISKEHLKEFCNMFGFILKNNMLPHRTENDLYTKDLCKLIPNAYNKYSEILNFLKELYNSEQRPEWCYKRQSGKHQTICIAKDHLQDFLDLCQFEYKGQRQDTTSVKKHTKTVKKQPKVVQKDLRVDDLIQCIQDGIKLSSKISEALRTLYTSSTPRPEWCYTIKQKHSKLHPICISKDHLEEFCNMFGFSVKGKESISVVEPEHIPITVNEIKEDIVKSDNSVSKNDLSIDMIKQYILNGDKLESSIKDSLEDLYTSSYKPDWCYEKNGIIYINKKYIKTFCDIYEYKYTEPVELILEHNKYVLDNLILQKSLSKTY